MAEFAIATGIVQVAGAGVALTKVLYNFGATASSAGEQTDFIGKNISLYCRVLKTLGQHLKARQPDHTEEALDVAYEIQEQTNTLFEKIRRLLPTSDRDGSGLTLKQKILWNFKKSRVDYLVGQLEYLKSTVNLLLHVLVSVPKLRRYRRSKKKSRREKEEVSTQLSEVQNLIYERCQAQRHLPVLAEKAERDSMLLLPSETPSEMSVATRSESHRELVKSSGPMLGQIDAYAAGLSGGDERTMILRKTNSWVAQLYEQWTTLSANNTEEESSFDAAAVADLIDTENANVSQETPYQARETPQTDNPMDKSGSQQAEINVTVENKPHNHQDCDCIRAKVEIPEFWDELERIGRWLAVWLGSCQDGSKLPNTCEEFLQKSARINELEHEYVANYMWPLHKKYLARVSDLCSITDSEIADLYCQKEEAIAKNDLVRSNKIEAFELPRLLERRWRLDHACADVLDTVQSVGCSLIIEGSSCEIPIRDASGHKPRNETKEAKAATAKIRDQNQRRDRSERLNRHVYVEDDSSSDFNTSTHATPATIRSPRMETIRSPSRTSRSSSIRQELGGTSSTRESQESRREPSRHAPSVPKPKTNAGLGGTPGGLQGFGGLPAGGTASGTRSFHFSAGGGNGGFSFGDPNDIFTNFAKQGGSGLGDDDDIFGMFSGMGGRSGGVRYSTGTPGSMR